MGSLGDVVESKDGSPRTHSDKKDETTDIKLMSLEGRIFHITEEVARQCEAIEHLIEDRCADDIIPVPNVRGQTLELILEWCKKHTYSVMKDMNKDELKEWEQKFFDIDLDTLNHLFCAANYLCHKRLLDECAEKVASLIRNRSPEEIREIFGIKNDFTPEELEEIKAPNAWAYE